MAIVPRDRLASWLPHVLLLGLLVGAVTWLLVLVAPVRSALVMGGSLALLTHPVLYSPLDRLMARSLPRWSARDNSLTSIPPVFASQAVRLPCSDCPS